MRIGIDGRNLKTNRAIFRYTKNLLNSLSQIDKKNDYFLFLEGEELIDEVNYLNLSSNWRLIKAPRRIVLKDHWFFNKFIEPFQLDVFFHPDNTEFLKCHPHSVVTIHDLIPYLLPDLSLSANKISRWRQNIYLNLQKKSLSASAKHIIAVSENTKRDLVKIFGLSPETITVIYESAEDSYRAAGAGEILEVRKTYHLNGGYFFCQTGFSPYKNALILVEAFDGFSRTNPGISLVLGGAYEEKGNYYRRVVEEVNRRHLNDKVIFTGFVPEALLPALYSGAESFIYPSLYEGFGLPPLEAQACGVPVLSSNAASLPEIVGDGAVYFNPTDVSGLSKSMGDIYNNQLLRKKLTGLGFENLKRFSWVKCAEKTLEVFTTVAKTIK